MPTNADLTPIPEGPFVISQLPKGGPGIRLSLVLPTYNEAKNIARVVSELTVLLDGRISLTYEIIIVDDDSPDGTWRLALESAGQHPHVRVIGRGGERGLSTAVVRGWQAASGEILAVLDADLQHPPELALKLMDQIDAGADLAMGSRHVEGGGVGDWSIPRRLISRGAQVIGLAVLPEVVGRVSDPMSGC